MSLLAIGTIVVMSEKGRFRYLNSHMNPHKGVGKIIEHRDDEGHVYQVEWDGGQDNCYCIGEIDPVVPVVTQEELDSLL